MRKFQYQKSEVGFIHEVNQNKIEETLLNVPDGKRMYFHCRAEDAVVVVTKKTLLATALRCIPGYFLKSMYDIRISEDGKDVYPVFRRVEQAAWDAAKAEYIKEKGEWVQHFDND